MKNQACKFLVLFPLPVPYRKEVKTFMDYVARYTELPPPYIDLPPHITFHRPITEIPFETLYHLVKGACTQARPARMTMDGISHFGSQYIVMPVHVTSQLAELWVQMKMLFERVAEYQHGPFDQDNTLHLTVARKTTGVFKRAWPHIKKLEVPELSVFVEYLEIHQKPILGGTWKRVAIFPIYPKPQKNVIKSLAV